MCDHPWERGGATGTTPPAARLIREALMVFSQDTGLISLLQPQKSQAIQRYRPAENILKLCLGIRQMICIAPVKRLARPLLFKKLVIPRLSGWVVFFLSCLCQSCH